MLPGDQLQVLQGFGLPPFGSAVLEPNLKRTQTTPTFTYLHNILKANNICVVLKVTINLDSYQIILKLPGFKKHLVCNIYK